MSQTIAPASFAQLLQEFFCQYLVAQRNVSPRTVASYRDSFTLLLRHASTKTKKVPVNLTLGDLDAPLILDFLDHLERERHNSARSRNARLAAIRSFMRFASFRDPLRLPTIQRVLAIPTKRFDRPMLDFLSREEIEAILAAPDRSTWSGQRDAVMFATFYNTGARVSEVIALRVEDVRLETHPFVHVHGKGRKHRAVPLWKSTAQQLKVWIARAGSDEPRPLFPNRNGKPLSRSGVEHRLGAAVAAASRQFPALKERRISPHTIRHTTAMHLLQSGVDITVIALWLGHETPSTTHLYVEADLKAKERALNALQPPLLKATRYRAEDSLLAFLERL